MTETNNYIENIKNYIENNIISNKVRNLEKERDKLITYYNIGKEIIKAQNEDKIKYGNSFIKKLSIELTDLYGKGYDYTNLRRMIKFYMFFPNVATLSPTFITWSHMREILPIKNEVKGNIPINKKLLNKYSNVEDIFFNEKNNYDMAISIKSINTNIQAKNATEIYHIATEIFKRNHNKNVFINDNNQIKVTNQDIKESINKVFNDRLQNKYLKDHLTIFSDLGNIIENSQLVNQTYESKNRSKYITWNYYFSGISIDNKLFDLEFDVVSRADGENHYRLQRIKKADARSTLPINGEVDLGTSASDKIISYSDA